MIKNIFDISREILSGIKKRKLDNELHEMSKQQLIENCKILLELEEDYKNIQSILYKDYLNGRSETYIKRQLKSVFCTLETLKAIGFDMRLDVNQFNKVAKKYNVKSYADHGIRYIPNKIKEGVLGARLRIITITCDEYYIQKNKLRSIEEGVKQIVKNIHNPSVINSMTIKD